MFLSSLLFLNPLKNLESDKGNQGSQVGTGGHHGKGGPGDPEGWMHTEREIIIICTVLQIKQVCNL